MAQYPNTNHPINPNNPYNPYAGRNQYDPFNSGYHSLNEEQAEEHAIVGREVLGKALQAYVEKSNRQFVRLAAMDHQHVPCNNPYTGFAESYIRESGIQIDLSEDNFKKLSILLGVAERTDPHAVHNFIEQKAEAIVGSRHEKERRLRDANPALASLHSKYQMTRKLITNAEGDDSTLCD